MDDIVSRSCTGMSNEGEGTNARKRRKIASSPQLCSQCRLLKLDRSFRRAHDFFAKSREGAYTRPKALRRQPHGPLYFEDCFLVHRFKDRLATESQCPLCSFFRSMRVHPDQPGSQQNYKLLAFCSTESSLFCLPRLKKSAAWEQMKHTIFMAVVPDMESIPPNGHEESWLEQDIPGVGTIHLVRSGNSIKNEILLGRELNEKVDFDVCRDWLSFCINHHELCGKENERSDPISRGFRVINCRADPPAVEERPWGTAYVALSYVWGRSTEDDKEWPNTVLHAVAVTKEMGLQCLWVDRLCINQNDPEEKAYLIGRMTTIYSEAQFTIVAAAGSGAAYGLPGVSNAPRKPQPKIEVEGLGLLVSTHPDPRLDIIESEWSARGWTYQEGVLSNRRLVFTDHQVYWECQCMAVHESVRIPLGLVHEPSKARMADFMLAGIFKGLTYSAGDSDRDKHLVIDEDTYLPDYGFPDHSAGSVRSVTRGLDEHIHAFSARNLSYDEDSLAAFQGVLGLYRSQSSVRHLLGMPIWTDQIAGAYPGVQITFALSLCSWYHRSGESLQLFISEECQRRCHLPSWTWAGWRGTVSWYVPPKDEHSVLMCNLIETEKIDFLWAADVYLRDESGAVELCLADAEAGSFDTVWSNDLRLIRIRNALTLKYFHCKPIKKEWFWRRLAGRQGREKYHGGMADWDSQWHRLAGRLVCIGISAQMTRAEWTAKHSQKELISVLLFVGRDPGTQHGRARFLTLRRVDSPNGAECWERVGIVQLTVSAPELGKYRTIHEVFRHLPVQHEGRSLLVR